VPSGLKGIPKKLRQTSLTGVEAGEYASEEDAPASGSVAGNEFDL
jgi:hypothetical protein